MNFSITLNKEQVKKKPGFHLRMLKPKSSQSSECTHIHQTSRKHLTNIICQKADSNCILGKERKGVLLVEFKQQGTIITAEVIVENTKKKV
jgi:hypothetical protein